MFVLVMHVIIEILKDPILVFSQQTAKKLNSNFGKGRHMYML